MQLGKGLSLAFLILGRDRPGVADQCLDVIAPDAREPRRAVWPEQNSERARQLLGVGVHLRGVGPELWTAAKGGSHRVDDELEVFAEQLAERRLQPRERAIEVGRKVSGTPARDSRSDDRAERELALIVHPLDPIGLRVVAGGVGIGEADEIVDVLLEAGADHWGGDPPRGEGVQEPRYSPGRSVELPAGGGPSGPVVLAGCPGARGPTPPLRTPDAPDIP